MSRLNLVTRVDGMTSNVMHKVMIGDIIYNGDILHPELANNLITYGNTIMDYSIFEQAVRLVGKQGLKDELTRITGIQNLHLSIMYKDDYKNRHILIETDDRFDSKYREEIV